MDVTQSVGSAWQRTREQLFRPFNAGTWLSFGVIFFLQSLSEGGLGYYRAPNFSSSSRGRGGAAPPPDFREMLEQARHWASDNAGLLIALVVVGAIVGLAVSLVVLWLGTRGQMMAIRAVMTGRPAIGEHWRETPAPAWSLFRFHVLLMAIALVLWGPLLALALYRLVDLVGSGVTDDALLIGLVPFIVVAGLLAVVFGAVQALLRNFVAPFMLHFDETATEAWKRFFGAARGNWGSIVLFFIIRMGLGLAMGLVVAVLTLCTCCIGALPVIHQTLLAPWFVFERAYGLYAIESLGPEYQMMQSIEPPGPPAPPGGYYPPPTPPYPPPPPM